MALTVQSVTGVAVVPAGFVRYVPATLEYEDVTFQSWIWGEKEGYTPDTETTQGGWSPCSGSPTCEELGGPEDCDIRHEPGELDCGTQPAKTERCCQRQERGPFITPRHWPITPI